MKDNLKTGLIRAVTILATVFAGFVIAAALAWPESTNPFGISLAFAAWFLAMIGGLLAGGGRPRHTVLSMAFLLLLIRAWLPTYTVGSNAPNHVAYYRNYGLDLYSINFVIGTLLHVILAILLAKAMDTVPKHLSWLRERFRERTPVESA